MVLLVATEHDRRLADRARLQLGGFTRADARAAGLTDSTLTSRRRRGRVIRLQPKVYADASVPDSPALREWAAVATVDGLAAVGFVSAAHHWWPSIWEQPDEIHVVTVGQRPRGSGIRAHRTQALPESDVTLVGAIPYTTPARTLRDISRPRFRWLARRSLTSAIRTGQVRAEELRALILGQPSFPGNRVLTELLAEMDPVTRRTRSQLEALYRRITVSRGLPEPAMNHPVIDASGRRRFIDAAYLPERVPVEIDSRYWHGLATDANDDMDRENAIVLVGWRSFLRFSEWQLEHVPHRVAATVSLALEAARRDVGR